MSKLWWQIDLENEEGEREELKILLSKIGSYFSTISEARSKRIVGSYQIRNSISLAWTDKGLMYGDDGAWKNVTSKMTSTQLVDVSCHLSHLAGHINSLKEIDGLSLANKNMEFF